MEEYYYISSENQFLKNSLWKIYGKKCFYCGRMIDINMLEVDHIIPKDRDKLVASDEKIEFQKYIKEIEFKGFKTDCVQNYLPSCGHCNKLKGNDFFTVANLRYFHEYTRKKGKKVIQEIEKLKYKKPPKEECKKNDELIQSSKKQENLFVSKQIIEGLNDSYYINGRGKVRIDAFLPVDFESELSCLILFEKQEISGCMFSFDEEKIQSLFFEGYGTGISSERNFIWYINNKEIALRLPYNRFVTDEETVKQLCDLTDDLYKEFHKRREELVNTVGGRLFEEVKPGRFKIIMLPKWIWNKMFDFAQSHDYMNGDGIWNTFSPINGIEKNMIRIYKNNSITDIKADVLVELTISNIGNENVNIIWNPGYTPYISEKMDGFNDVQKWTVEYTHDWIINEFIPYIFYLEEMKHKSLLKMVFRKDNNFDSFKKKFNVQEYNIISCKVDG